MVEWSSPYRTHNGGHLSGAGARARRGAAAMASWGPLGALLACVLLLLLLLGGASALDEEALPGWKGESHSVLRQAANGEEVDNNQRDDSVLRRDRDTGIDPTRVTQVSSEPRAFVYHGLLSHDECDHLVSLARPQLEESMVTDNDSGEGLKSQVRTSSGMFIATKAKPKIQRSAVTDNDSGRSRLSSIRTSSGMFLNKYQDDVVKRIERRIADWTFLPVENGEAIQVLRYEDGQKYDAHFDYFHDKINSALGGHRYATVLMYLSDVEEGGETVFPSAVVPPGLDKSGLSECARRGIAVKPKKGDALLFYSLHLDGTTDEHSLHAGCPVIKGEKWSATKWIHVLSFEARTAQSGCQDLHPNCVEWAAMGECAKNPVYMVGDNGSGGNCRKACKKC